MDELRTIFTLSDTAIERARSFRTERMKRFTGIGTTLGYGRFIFHIIPLSAVSTTTTIEAKRIYENHSAFQPLAYMGMTSHYNFEGVINVRSGGINLGYTQIFRSGIVEAVLAKLVISSGGKNHIDGLVLEQNFFAVFSNYINGLKTLDIEPPLVLMLTLEGVNGCYYLVIRDKERQLIPFDRNVIYLPECIIEEFGDDANYHRAIKPAFDSLWNAVGYSESQFFDDNTGLWSGR